MNDYTRGLFLGLVTGFLLGAAVGTVVLAKAQGWDDPYARANEQIGQDMQADLQWQILRELQSQEFNRQMREQFPPRSMRPPC